LEVLNVAHIQGIRGTEELNSIQKYEYPTINSMRKPVLGIGDTESAAILILPFQEFLFNTVNPTNNGGRLV